jgi:beta-hydroxylase
MSIRTIYRIVSREEAGRCAAAGEVVKRPDEDAFLHCATRDQLADVLEAHFESAGPLALLELDAAALGEGLEWERSKSGALYPHIYGPAPFSCVRTVHLVGMTEGGAYRLPEDLPA